MLRTNARIKLNYKRESGQPNQRYELSTFFQALTLDIEIRLFKIANN